jgi:signal transduction histidine kinase
MKYAATEGVTPAHLQNPGRQNNVAIGVVVLIFTASLLWMLFHVVGNHTIGLFSDIIYTLSSLIGATWAWNTFYQGRRGALKLKLRYQVAWFLIGLGLLANGLDGAYFIYLEYNGQLHAAPAYTESWFTLFYPLALAVLMLVLILKEREQRLQEVQQFYRQLQTEHQQLREIDQLRDQFLMTASHELRTPLTTVQGYLELMAQLHDELSPEKRLEYLQKAKRSCDELVTLLSNVMDAKRLEADAKMHPAQMERILVQDMIQSVMNLIEPRLIKEQREVDLHIPPDLHVQANPGRLRQVLLNISINALKYSPPHTPIAIAAQVVADSRSAVVISVTDKGKGIAPEDQSRVFQLFVRLERDINSNIRGSGLGLYISYRLIEAMDGKIWIESKGIPGEGTTVHIQLPLVTHDSFYNDQKV